MTHLVTASNSGPLLVPRQTPVVHVSGIGDTRSSLWIKRDDLTHPGYGGNKVRKLARILEDARSKGAKRLVTIGAAGSHHVLATAYFGRAAGFSVEAVMVPQRHTEHVERNLRAGLALGLTVIPARSYLEVPFLVAARLGRGAYFIPVGGSNVTGALGYVDAAGELAQQVHAGELPEPDLCFVTLGSGGTFAGLVAGFERAKLKTRVVGVTVSGPAWFVELSARFLTWRVARRSGLPVPFRILSNRMQTTHEYLGRGYGEPTPAGDEATRVALEMGIILDGTYTAKTFAAVLAAVKENRAPTILYWHTLSSADMTPMLLEATPSPLLSQSVARLLTGGVTSRT